MRRASLGSQAPKSKNKWEGSGWVCLMLKSKNATAARKAFAAKSEPVSATIADLFARFQSLEFL